MKLRIQSDGTFDGTKVENAETGEMLEGVVKVAWRFDANADWPQAVIVVEQVHVDLVAKHPDTLVGWLAETVECHVVDNAGQQS